MWNLDGLATRRGVNAVAACPLSLRLATQHEVGAVRIAVKEADGRNRSGHDG